MIKEKHVCFCLVLGLMVAAESARGGIGELPGLSFDTELTSLDLTGGPFPFPLASDPTNALGDSVEGYGFVDSFVSLTLSSQRTADPGPSSLGEAFASLEQPSSPEAEPIFDGPGDLPTIDPNEMDGKFFSVNSFFNVFFDITVTDVDDRPGRNFNPTEPAVSTGTSVQLQDNGPARMQSSYQAVFDKDAPNFGLIPPPETDPYIGHFNIEIPLGVDINGNGENDKIKFSLATHSVGTENRQFITLSDGTIIDEFDSAAFLEGAVVDESTDPPFTIGVRLPNGLPDPNAFGGPTSATSQLQNPIIPEPASAMLWLMSLITLSGVTRRCRRGSC